MSYIGINPQLRAYKDAYFVAIGGETVIPIKCEMETLVIKNGSFLVPKIDYYINREKTISIFTAASKDDEYYIVDISTFSFSESITRTEVEDMLDSTSDPIFEVLWWPSRNSVPAGLVPADGQELPRGLYMDAFTGIEAGLVPLVSDADWLSTPSKRASYTKGDGSTTFRVPDYNGRTEGNLGALVLRGDGKNAAPAGNIQEDAIRNITAGFRTPYSETYSIIEGHLGAIYGEGRDATTFMAGDRLAGAYGNPAGSPARKENTKFDASRVVPTASENRMVNTAGVWCIRLFSGTVYAGRANAAQLATEVGKLQSQVQQLESEMVMNKWYSNGTQEFQSRFEFINGWEAGKDECLMKETAYEIRFKGILRRSSPHTNTAMLKIKNPNGDRLVSPYTPMICNISNAGGGFVSIYSEPVNISGEGYFSLSTSGVPSITGWIMVEFTITKNPGLG